MITSSRKRVCAGAQTTVNQNVENQASPALHNHLILKRIISFLSVSDLKQFRLVNRFWNQQSLLTIRNKVHSIKISKTSSNSEIKSLIKLINNSNSGFPCVDFKMSSDFVQNDHNLFNKTLIAISSFVKELDLEIKHCKPVIKFAGMKFSNLKTLKIYQPDWNTSQAAETLKCFQFVMRNGPVLEKIELRIASGNDKKTTAEIIESIGTHSNLKNVSALRMAIGIGITNGQLFDLGSIGLRLRKLSLTLGHPRECTPEGLRNFLASQSNILEELTLTSMYSQNAHSPALLFPRMEKLKSLKLSMFCEDILAVPFSKLFPALKHALLENYQRNINSENVSPSNIEPLHTVESLVLSMRYDESEMLKQASCMFPMVTKLEVFCSKAVIQKAGSVMKNLEELVLSIDSKKSNNAFIKLMTGYNENELAALERTWTESRNLQLKKTTKPAKVFQQLKMLRVDMDQFTITDVLCLLGPMKMGSLECLDLRQSKAEICQHVLEQMQKKFRVLIKDECVYKHNMNCN